MVTGSTLIIPGNRDDSLAAIRGGGTGGSIDSYWEQVVTTVEVASLGIVTSLLQRCTRSDVEVHEFRPEPTRPYQEASLLRRCTRSDVDVYEFRPEPTYPYREDFFWLIEYVEQHELTESVATAEVLVQETFGPDAYLEQRVQIDPETGEKEFVVVAHYAYHGGIDDLLPKHDAFLRSYMANLPLEHRARIVLTWSC